MTFPKRWLDDDSEAAAPMRDVLRTGSGMDAPDGAENAVWLALMGKVGAAGAGGAAGGGAAGKAAAGASAKAAAAASTAGGAVGGGMLKAIVVGALSGVVAVSGYSALESKMGWGQGGAPSAPSASISSRASAAQAPGIELSASSAAAPAIAPSGSP